MSMNNKRNILISVPYASEELKYFPYIYTALKTHCDHVDNLNEVFEWLDPVYERGKASLLFEPYKNTSVDVLGLSCYIWNFDLQCSIAQYAKELNPECLVVAGGPHLDFKDPNLFHKYPYIDIVIVQDGEIPFSKILTKLTHGEKDFTDIPGLYLPTPDRKGSLHTGPTELPTVFEHSPFIGQSGYVEKFIQRNNATFIVSWETNRGCPYGCSYCNWGSNVKSKIRQINIERIKAEADWFGRMKINSIMVTDANFGMLQRDVEIVDFITAAFKKHGYPKMFVYQAAKNVPYRSVEIAKKIHSSGINSFAPISIQHTREHVLRCIDRENISIEKQKEVIMDLKDTDIPIMVELIVGMPGDNYDEWKSCLADIMEWGLHDSYAIFPFILLPNTPASEKSYIEKYQIETIELREAVRINRSSEFNLINKLSNARFVVKTKTYSRDDWVRMKTYSSFIQALHSFGVTQNIALYLRFTHNVAYKEFYENLIEYLTDTNGLVCELHKAITNINKNVLADKNAIEFLEVEQLPELQYLLEGYQWIFVQICLHIDRFFDDLRMYLLEKYPFATNLESSIDYQKNLIILPDYNRETGKVFPTDFDWVKYFKRAKRLAMDESLSEPDHTPGAMVEVNDKYSGDFKKCQLDWESDNLEDRWKCWIERTVVGYSPSSRNYFKQLSLRTKECSSELLCK